MSDTFKFGDLAMVVWCLLVVWMIWKNLRGEPTSVNPTEEADLPAVIREWQSDTSVFDQPELFGYRVYSQQHDRCVEAGDLIDEAPAAERRALLSRIILSYHDATSHLARRLKELGVTSSTSAALLIDHSGSMRRKSGNGPEYASWPGPVVDQDSGAALAAGLAISIATALEECGSAVEILGFTTSEWKGGKTRLDWLASSKPPRPGRLNDLLHIVYKRSDETPVAHYSPRLDALLRTALLKENIDGEAIAWARSRLLAQRAADRLLIYISDGAPVDDSTLKENGPSYLERHLLHVVNDIERRRDLRIVGIGIGYDLHRYVPQFVALKPGEAFVDQKLDALAGMIAGPSRPVMAQPIG
jgi:cobaltochelatase CobT